MNIRNPHTEFYEPAFIDEEDGIDGVFVEGEVPEGVGHAAIVKKPNQIKSATENNGEFSEKNNDISFRFTEEEQSIIDEAKKIYHWLKATLFNPETGAVADNIARNGRKNWRWLFTYNQGTFLGAAHELYLITGDKSYLEDAQKAADFVMNRMSNNNGVLGDATNGDGGLFHGIFFRYFVKLINEENLDLATRQKYHAYLTHLANVMAEHGINTKTKLYAGTWWKAPDQNAPVALTAHVTGCMLMEAMCVLKPIQEK